MKLFDFPRVDSDGVIVYYNLYHLRNSNEVAIKFFKRPKNISVEELNRYFGNLLEGLTFQIKPIVAVELNGFSKQETIDIRGKREVLISLCSMGNNKYVIKPNITLFPHHMRTNELSINCITGVINQLSNGNMIDALITDVILSMRKKEKSAKVLDVNHQVYIESRKSFEMYLLDTFTRSQIITLSDEYLYRGRGLYSFLLVNGILVNTFVSKHLLIPAKLEDETDKAGYILSDTWFPEAKNLLIAYDENNKLRMLFSTTTRNLKSRIQGQYPKYGYILHVEVKAIKEPIRMGNMITLQSEKSKDILKYDCLKNRLLKFYRSSFNIGYRIQLTNAQWDDFYMRLDNQLKPLIEV